MIISDRVPIDKFSQFDAILKQTNGRYLRNPDTCGDHVHVVYSPGNYQEQCEAWRRCTMVIKETRRDQWYRVLARRVKLMFTREF